jgi:hypothetical protein
MNAPRVAMLALVVGAAGGCGGGSAATDGGAGASGAAGSTGATGGAGATGAAGAGTAGTGAAGTGAAGMGAAGSGAAGTGVQDAGSGAKADTGPAPADAPVESAPGEVQVPAGCMACAAYGTPAPIGRVTGATMDQLSGIAASHKNPGVLYVHNDRTSTTVWAISEAGAVLATFNFTGVTVRDVEDVSVGPCATGTCVYLADIGGNLGARPDFTIVRFPEPTVAIGAPGSAAPVNVAAEKLVYTYPDGMLHNAESLLVDPRSGTTYVIDKVAAGMHSTAYRLSATFGGAPIVATKLMELPVPAAGDMPAIAADAHPCGAGFILATGNTAYEFRIAPTAPFEDAFKATPAVVPAAQEQQREGITYAPDGRGYYTNSEGSMQPINRVGCK